MKGEYILIKNAHIADCMSKSATSGDILLRLRTIDTRGEILAVGAKITEQDASKLGAQNVTTEDARGCLAIPAFTDMHCHLREPGEEEKETVFTGTSAAAAGGYGGVVSMPNTKPATDTVERLNTIIANAKKWSVCNVYPTAAITIGQNGRTLCDFKALADAGAVAFTDDGRPVSDSGVMLEAMKICAENGYMLISHCEELSLSAEGVMNESKTSRLLNVKGITNAAEEVMISRDIILAEQTGCRLHIAHVSTAGGMRLIREAKARGVNVTCETCPHYFSFCDEDVMFYGANAKMNPPLRSRRDVAAVIEAIRDGTVDVISTDHAPHTPKDKSGQLSEAKNGITGLQTAFAAAMTYLVQPGYINIYKLIELLSLRPADILGHDSGLYAGSTQSVTLVNPNREIVISRNMLKSKSFNTPYMGLSLRGSVEKTFVL